jgi:alkanesulfonate monooxygenase SsuD/methylene tetrahydromethanopterin reductase-like flavin-dependent oxidoreductase (luciferase family)
LERRAGRGFERSEFKAFGIPGEESASRFHETVDIVLKAWTREKLSYRGKYYSYEGVEVLPKPLQATAPTRMDGGNLGAGDRLGSGQRLFDPDGPALVAR